MKLQRMDRLLFLALAIIFAFLAILTPYLTAKLSNNYGFGFFTGFTLVSISMFPVLFFILGFRFTLTKAIPTFIAKTNQVFEKISLKFILRIDFPASNEFYTKFENRDCGIAMGFWHGLLIYPTMFASSLSKYSAFFDANRKKGYFIGYSIGFLLGWVFFILIFSVGS